MPRYKLATNDNNKATELPLCRIRGTVAQNPHMRAFWAATISFFLAFLGWFALAPLGLEVATSMGICENQEFPPGEYPRRKAYVTYENIHTLKPYCRHGANSDESDCSEAPPELLERAGCNSTSDFTLPTNDTTNCSELGKYDPDVLAKCVCTPGTYCRNVLGDAGVASVASTIFVRVAMGTLLERFGPVNVQTGLMTFGAVWVAIAAAINHPWNFIVIRFFIGAAGATFVTNQFWCSLMFAPNVVGTANATAAGWGNLGGGVTQAFMMICLFHPFVNAGMAEGTAWRVAMFVPAFLFLVVAVSMQMLCWDTPTKRRFDPVADTGKSKGASMTDYFEVLRDRRVLVMIFQYSACFGTELAMNNELATHFRVYFQLPADDAALLAASFGGMNIFARSLGGIASDVLFKFVGFRGRIWVQFLALFFEAIFLYGFGSVEKTQPLGMALAVLVCFSLFVQMAEGTSYGIVPFMSKTQLACVSALVGAGGNLGAVIVRFAFYRPIDDPLKPFQAHAGYVMLGALLSPLYYWPEHGGMFCGPQLGGAEAGNKA